MKKSITTFVAAIALFFSATAFAAPAAAPVNEEIKLAFQKNYADVGTVSWTESQGFYFASFIKDDLQYGAAFNEDGELVGTSKEMNSAELPETVKSSLQKKYADYEIAGLVTQVQFDGSTSYFVTATAAGKTLRLQCFEAGGISLAKRTKTV